MHLKPTHYYIFYIFILLHFLHYPVFSMLFMFEAWNDVVFKNPHKTSILTFFSIYSKLRDFTLSAQLVQKSAASEHFYTLRSC